jgi:hypothetical protein
VPRKRAARVQGKIERRTWDEARPRPSAVAWARDPRCVGALPCGRAGSCRVQEAFYAFFAWLSGKKCKVCGQCDGHRHRHRPLLTAKKVALVGFELWRRFT